MKAAATTPAKRKTGAAGKVAVRKAAAPKVATRAKAQTRLQLRAVDAPLVRADLKRPPARLSTSLAAFAGAALKSPRKTLGGLGRAVSELVQVVRGRSTVAPAPGDKRFEDVAFRENALYRRLMQGHLALARQLQKLAGELGLSPRDEARAKMALGMVADTLAPTNTLLGNPAALKRTLDTGGRNLVAGVTQLVDDWRHNGRLPSSVDVSKFKVGGNLAMTPGDVVFRSEQLELIQYRPQTAAVHGTPSTTSGTWHPGAA